MNIKYLAAVALLCASQITLAATNELGWTLDSALKQIDRQADDFSTALADVEAIWKASDADEPHRSSAGRLYVNEDGILRFHLESPEESILLVTKSEVQDSKPVQALVERFALSKHPGRLEPYARLGFTTTGMDLRDYYLVTLLGEDYLDGRRIIGL